MNDDPGLREGFAAFIAASRRLEQGYAALKARAAAVDMELAATNRRLAAALDEREAIFRALPVGLVAAGSAGVTFCNAEGERLWHLADAHGVDPLAAEGDIVLGAATVRVRRAALPDGALVLLEDRSQVVGLEREVHRLDRLAGLSELAMGVAHEIKNPLNGAMGFAALLERNPEPAACRRHATRIVQGLRQVDGIVKGLLAFARPDGRRAPPLPLASLVGEACAAAALPPAQVELRGEHGLRAPGDALVRVLAILFRNSLEAAGAAVRITIDCQAADGWLELRVRDDGPGVPAQLGSRVFEPFVSSKERGTGLGLPLASRVLSFLGGSLHLDEGEGPGACFRLRLPLAGAPAPSATAQEVGA